MSTRDPAPEEQADDEALHWAGDEARGREAPRLGGTASGAADEELAAVGPTVAERAPRDPRAMALLVATGVLGVVYAAIAVGWVLSVQALRYPGLDLGGEIMWQFAEFLSMIAPVLWFGATVSLTPEGVSRRGLTRVAWLVAGAVVLLPWPVLLEVLA